MIKGCRKEMIIVKETGSPYFEEAYFVIRPGCEAVCGDIVKEALKIAEDAADRISGEMKKRNLVRMRYMVAGASACSFLFGAVMLAVVLLG